jgi:pyruvate dehydrogenase E1 component beta subunit
MHIPGLKLVMPSTCYDAKGLLLAAIADPNPVLVIDHRYNFKQKGQVPEGLYRLPLGQGVIRRPGKQVTVVAISHLVLEAYQAAQELSAEGIDAEIIDPRTLRPLDEKLILDSVARTGRLVVADTGWKTGGVTAEISALVAEKGFASLKAPIQRVAAPDLPTPAGFTLEEAYYIGKEDIKQAIREIAA